MTSNPRKLLALCVLAIGFLGCAASPTPVTLYLLRSDVDDYSGPVDRGIRAGLGRVVVAPYLLASKGVMVRTGENEIRPAAHHLWAEPLDAGLRWYLRTEIGRALGYRIGGGITDRLAWDYTIDVVVSQLHGTMSGEATILADFTIVPRDKTVPVSQMRFSKTVPLPEEGYNGIVEAEKTLARELAKLIAEELERLREA